MNSLKADMPSLVRVLRGLSNRGLIRLSSLPRDLEEDFVGQIQNELDMLDLSYIESGIAPPEYVSSRRALAGQLEIFPSHTEPLSPLEAAHLFREKERALWKILHLTGSRPSEASKNDVLSTGARWLPFSKFIHSRISKLRASTEERPDLPSEKRMRMLLLFSQVGLSRLATVEEVAKDLLEELEALGARCLVGEISQSDLTNKEKALWDEIPERMTPQLPNHEDFASWLEGLNVKLDAARSLRDKGILTENLFEAISEDLSEDITLLKAHISF